MQNVIRKTLGTLTILTFLISNSGCGTATGNPKVSIQIGSYSEAALFEWLIPSAFAAVTEVTFCFKRLRFKTDSSNSSTTSDNIDFALGEVTLSTSGTTLSEVEVSPDTYERVEFDFEDDCTDGSGDFSVKITNSMGTYRTTDRITAKFFGSFTADSANETLSLGVQNIVTALDGVAGDTEIKDAIENASGSF